MFIKKMICSQHIRFVHQIFVPEGPWGALGGPGGPWEALGGPGEPWGALGGPGGPWGALGALGSLGALGPPRVCVSLLSSLLDGPTGPHYPCVSLGCLWGPMVALEGPWGALGGPGGPWGP